jgi:preprotein translocase subunit SecG
VPFFPILAFAQGLFGILLVLMAIFLILLVLVQRGRGGGLAGALGGMGGSSAFGAKAGDVFTRITIIAAAIWIVLCIAASRWGSSTSSRINIQGGGSSAAGAVDPGEDEEVSAPADEESANDEASAEEAKTEGPGDSTAASAGDGDASAAPAGEGAPAATGDASSDQ